MFYHKASHESRSILEAPCYIIASSAEYIYKGVVLDSLIREPAKTTEAKELPLIPSHADVHYSFIDDF